MKDFDREFVNTFKKRFNEMNSEEQMDTIIEIISTLQVLSVDIKSLMKNKQGRRIIQENMQLIVGSNVFDNLLQLSCDVHNLTVLMKGDINDITCDTELLDNIRKPWKAYRSIWNRIFLKGEKKEKKDNIICFRSRQ